MSILQQPAAIGAAVLIVFAAANYVEGVLAERPHATTARLAGFGLLYVAAALLVYLFLAIAFKLALGDVPDLRLAGHTWQQNIDALFGENTRSVYYWSTLALLAGITKVRPVARADARIREYLYRHAAMSRRARYLSLVLREGPLDPDPDQLAAAHAAMRERGVRDRDMPGAADAVGGLGPAETWLRLELLSQWARGRARDRVFGRYLSAGNSGYAEVQSELEELGAVIRQVMGMSRTRGRPEFDRVYGHCRRYYEERITELLRRYADVVVSALLKSGARPEMRRREIVGLIGRNAISERMTFAEFGTTVMVLLVGIPVFFWILQGIGWLHDLADPKIILYGTVSAIMYGIAIGSVAWSMRERPGSDAPIDTVGRYARPAALSLLFFTLVMLLYNGVFVRTGEEVIVQGFEFQAAVAGFPRSAPWLIVPVGVAIALVVLLEGRLLAPSRLRVGKEAAFLALATAALVGIVVTASPHLPVAVIGVHAAIAGAIGACVPSLFRKMPRDDDAAVQMLVSECAERMAEEPIDEPPAGAAGA